MNKNTIFCLEKFYILHIPLYATSRWIKKTGNIMGKNRDYFVQKR